MSRAKPIIVGSSRFESKKAAIEFIQAILHDYAPGRRVSPEHDAFLRDLVELHPDRDSKVQCGIDHFTVERNEGSNGFWLTRVDGSSTDWSFYACLTPPTPETEARRGFRSAVRTQISRTPFDVILQGFLREEGLALRDVSVRPTEDGSTRTELADDDLRARWQRYHRHNAAL